MRISDWSSDVCCSDLASSTSGNDRIAAANSSRLARPCALSFTCAKICALRPTFWRSTSATRRVMTPRSEEHTSDLQSLMRISYAVFCLNKNNEHRPLINHIIVHTYTILIYTTHT